LQTNHTLRLVRLPTKNGLLDWDCMEAISIPDMERSLAHIRSHGTFPVSHPSRLSRRSSHGYDAEALPSHSHARRRRADHNPSLTLHCAPQPDLDSKEDQNTVGECPVPDAKIAVMRERVEEWLQPGKPGHAFLEGQNLRVCFLDGFLLYAPEMQSVMDLIDLKLFLLVSKEKATHRREARDGYVTLEGFWKDPPGYVEKIVWPNYVEAHSWLFEKGDVEGELNKAILSEKDIHAQLGQGLDIPMEKTLDWAVGEVMKTLERYI